MINRSPARWWIPEDHLAVRCLLCPRKCLIAPGARGFCAVRENREGALYSLVYGQPAALQNDPIEKKPLHHFLPRTRIFSIGTMGCNLACLFCQNDSLSACAPRENMDLRFFTPSELVELALQQHCPSIAFTYNEPTVFAEYALDIAILAHQAGLKTVWVTNGFITPEAAKEIYPHIDAANIDMKGFSEDFYTSMCRGSLQPVLDAIEFFRCSLGKHVELTNLVIPGKNDSPEMIDGWLDWVERKLGFGVPLHFSAYYPAFRFRSAPPTPPQQLHEIGRHAQERGFKYVHLGNI
ncbi:MAG: AmmeMemoRadiSam system radical SAM enzyme [Lentisphaeria bacterium]|nr:AmmeMemoRadiSam system radical SAM enzyme [Lentisphaeria bacterium]